MLLRFFRFVEFVVDVVVLLNLWLSVVGFLLGWWWLVEYMVGLCWVCGGRRILLGLWWVFFLFYVAPNTVKYSEKKPFSLKLFTLAYNPRKARDNFDVKYLKFSIKW